MSGLPLRGSDDGNHVLWQRCLRADLAPSSRIIESKLARMQHLTLRLIGELAAIKRIGQQRVPQAGQVDPNLMGAPGFQPARELGNAVTRVFACALTDVMGDGRLGSNGSIYAHAHGHFRITTDRQIDFARWEGAAVHEGHVFTPHGACLQLPHEMRLRRFRARDDQQAGGVLVQTMDDTRTSDMGKLGKAVKQTIEQRALPVARTRMGNQAGRFVDNDPVRAFLHHIECNGLGRVGALFRRNLRPDAQRIAAVYKLPDLCLAAIDMDETLFDPPLEPAAAMLRKQAGEHFIQALRPDIVGHGKREGLLFREGVCRASRIEHGDNHIISERHATTKDKAVVNSASFSLSPLPRAVHAEPAATRVSGARRVLTYVLFLAAFILVLSGCAGKPKVDPTAGWSAEQLYSDARAEIAAANWNNARERLTAVESRYPFSVHAQQALMELAYVNWKDGENEQALSAIERFQQQFPNHPGTDYMLYLKGLINFTPASAFMANLTGQDPAERDPKGLRASYDSFTELITRYPDSKYAPDAQARMNWLVNTIAMNEVYVARYYYERGAYIAAANRAQTVITDFEGVAANEQALYIMMLSYDKLNMTTLRDDAERVLDKNFPNSTLKTKGFATREKPWWNPGGWF